MAKRVNVGRSIKRTPAKHKLMDRLVGSEVGMAARILQPKGVNRELFIDLTAGDAAPPNCFDVLSWAESCSPGILAYHGRNVGITTEIHLYERAIATFDALNHNLSNWLPVLEYERDGDCWRHSKSPTVIRAFLKSGSEAQISDVTRQTAVFVTHDPNHIHDWAMRPSFASEIRARTPWFRSITTMGCNVGGLKMLELSERQRWFEFLHSISGNLYRHHDLFLCAINGDASQWAYLIETSEKSFHREKLEKDAHGAFKRNGLSIRHAWLRQNAEDFDRIVGELFLTKDERNAA